MNNSNGIMAGLAALCGLGLGFTTLRLVIIFVSIYVIFQSMDENGEAFLGYSEPIPGLVTVAKFYGIEFDEDRWVWTKKS